MIVNELKPCCKDCGDIGGYFDTDKVELLNGSKYAMSRLYCKHQAACKKYIECTEKPVEFI